MIRIAVCDDEPVFADFLITNLKDIFSQLSVDVSFSEFKSSVLLAHRHAEEPFDILFLDIDMPNLSGFELAEKIRTDSYRTFIIFVTGKQELVYNSFAYQPFDFICKKISSEMRRDLEATVKRLLPFYRQNKIIEIADHHKTTQALPVSEILYVQSEKHYLLYFLTTGESEPLRERAVMSEREPLLISLHFIKPHQRYLVNMHYIRRYDILLNTVLLCDKIQIPISKRYKASALESYKQFKRR